MKLFLLAIALVALTAAADSSTDKIWPKPVVFSSEPHGETVTVSPCDVQYAIEATQQT